jgi:hypothetical protein
MSRIYAGGNRATAVANIKADVAAYISFDASGRKVVDVDGLWGYLVAQGQAIITDAEYVSPATAATAAAAMKTINGRDMAQQLADLIGPQRWSSRPDWPTNTQQLTGGTQAAAVKSALAEVARLTEEYDAILTRQSDLLTRTVNALRGNPPPLTSWSHHDIPELAAEKVAEVARLTAERDALAAQVARVEALGEEWLAMDEANADYFSRERLDPTLAVRVATVRQEQLQAALADTEADTGEQEAGHRCEPYYSRSQCGQCGWQEQWCVTCSRQMCGCATDAMGADQ